MGRTEYKAKPRSAHGTPEADSEDSQYDEDGNHLGKGKKNQILIISLGAPLPRHFPEHHQLAWAAKFGRIFSALFKMLTTTSSFLCRSRSISVRNVRPISG